MAGLSDILTIVQHGVTAANDFGKQVSGSFRNISGQLTANAAAISALSSTVAAISSNIPTTFVTTIAGNSSAFTLNGGSGITNAVNDILLSQGSSSQFGAIKVDGTSIIATSGVIATKNSLRVLLNTLTAANSATLSDTTNFSSAYSEYEIVFENMLPATNAVTLQLQVNTGGGLQSTVYVATSFNGDVAYGTVQFTNCIPCSESANVINTAGPGLSGKVTAYKWNAGGTIATQWRGDFVHLITATRMGFCSGVGYWNSTTALTGVTISFSAGNITSGTVKIYGIQ